MHRINQYPDTPEVSMVLRAPRWLVLIPGSLAAMGVVAVVISFYIGSQPTSEIIGMFATTALLAYGAHYANDKFIITSQGLEWRGPWGFGWNKVHAHQIQNVTFSRGSLWNHPVVLLELHDGQTLHAPMPGIEDDERDRAFEAIQKIIDQANHPTEL